MNSITHRQINVDLFSDEKGLHFQHEGQDHVLSNMDKVHEFFQTQSFDTVKHCQDGKREFLSKKTLRKTLSQENGGAWIEEKDGKKRYFIDDSGWFQTSFKQVSKKEYLQKLESPSTIQKVLGLGLGILALSPGMVEFARHIPQEMGMGLLALQQKSPLLGALGYSLIPSSVEAQAVGTEFQVNNYTIGNQTNPTVARLVNGEFVVAWQSDSQDGDLNGIFAQLYDSTGTLIGSEFQVNSYTTSNQRYPAIAPLNDGGFVVVWESFEQDGVQYGIYAQRYVSSGALFGSEFRVNNYTISNQHNPTISPLNDGGFVITWESLNQDGDSWGIFAQRYDSSGALFGSEFQVNNYMTSHQRFPAIAPLNDGGFVVVWDSNGQDGDEEGIFAQRYDSSGALFGSEFQVNSYTTSIQRYPAIAQLTDGGFIVVWESFEQDGIQYGIYAQRYVASGALFGSEFQINSYTTSNQHNPAIAPLNDGGFVVAWESLNQDGDSWGIFAQRYASSGALFGPEFQVNDYVTRNQRFPSIAPLNDGGFVVTWQSEGQDGDVWGIFAQRYNQNGNPVPLAFVPSKSSESALGSNANSTDFRLSFESSWTTGEILSARTTPSLSFSSISEMQTTMQTGSSTSSGSGIPSIIDVVYGQSYSATQNGQTVGTFTITGGSGPYSSSNPNTLEIQLNPNYVLQAGDILTLFSVPGGEEVLWEGINFLSGEECFTAEGELVPNSDTNQNDYQLIFDVDEDQCSIYSDASKFSAIPVLAGGGLI